LPPPPAAEKVIAVESDLLKILITNRGGQIKSWQLKRYLEPDGSMVEMVGKNTGPHSSFALLSWSHDREANSGIYRTKPQQLLLSESQPKGTLVMQHTTGSGLELTKSLTFHNDDYKVDIETRVRNLSRREQTVSFDLLWGPGIRGRGEKEKKEQALKPVMTVVNGRRIQDKWEKMEGAVEHEGAVSWTAVHDNYFCAALIPLEKGGYSRVERLKEAGPVVSLVFPEKKLPPGESISQSYAAFIGPKEIDRLTRLGFGMREVIDLGWFDFLARPALFFLKYTFNYVKNYGLAIIVLTVLMRIILFPLTYKSFKSMQEMQRLQPKINTLRERFKDDSKRMNQELMELYRKHNLNPLGGCLPMVLQIPIFIALYNALINSVELWRAPLIWWIKDLSAKDPYYVLPILMGASWVIQQIMTPTVGDPRQAKMMLMMPVIFTFMFLNFPSGLVLYFLVSNLLGIGQQYLMNRQLKAPSKAGGEG
jgi:YidC/Oxa1 family membrane protein insertase